MEQLALVMVPMEAQAGQAGLEASGRRGIMVNMDPGAVMAPPPPVDQVVEPVHPEAAPEREDQTWQEPIILLQAWRLSLWEEEAEEDRVEQEREEEAEEEAEEDVRGLQILLAGELKELQGQTARQVAMEEAEAPEAQEAGSYLLTPRAYL